MKKLLVTCFALLSLHSSEGQTKKSSGKKPIARTSKTVDEPMSKLDASTAGKYAKDLGKQMFSRVDFEQEKGGYSMSINRWKPLSFERADGIKATWYMIDVTIRWQSSQGGWPTRWNDVEYNGIILCDEFGCEPNFLVKTKQEPSSKGLAALVVKHSPTGELDDQQKQAFGTLDEWLEGVNYVWNPGGCLE